MQTEYFEMLKSVMIKHNFLNNPSQIYNVDETGMPLDHGHPKLLGKRRRIVELQAPKFRSQW